MDFFRTNLQKILHRHTGDLALRGDLQVLQSGWPIFGLLGLIAYKLSRDGAGKGVVCDQPIESFRIRYEEPESLTRMEEVKSRGSVVVVCCDGSYVFLCSGR